MGLAFNPPHRSRTLRTLTLSLLGLMSLCLVQCGVQKGPSPPQAVPSLYCTATSTCISAANLPFCADAYTSFCNTSFNECMYRIKNNANCPCIERDVRACPLPGGGQGIQECVVDSPKTHTWWNTCHAC
jgi:hypothetical protein